MADADSAAARNPEETRDILLALRARLQSDRSLQRGGLGGDVVRAPLHPADAATDAQAAEFVASRLTDNSTFLEDVDDAIDRLDRGEYGVCVECHAPIGAGRLRAKPWARMCIACKRREEKEAQG